ncbi:restriction endonuclease subunit S [Petrocella sp. FN5]|uniref:restriction endonuclease subunit S n=1 Tax=Petrocella sp. FN5 TaxID=3032002 RepID=UPI0023DBC216|nr:restriction endonuclease subunit S [Petrocella sp. FN5]MDF1617983.1 restriction endonuclease subunit S [Petrocella sp. FN5]
MKIEKCGLLFTDGNWIESKDQASEGIRLIQTGNIGNGKFLEKENRSKYISEETFLNLKCTEIFAGDILISRLPEPVGRACIIPEKEERMITAVDCSILRVDENVVDKKYLLHFLKSPVYFQALAGKLAGTTRVRVSRKNLGLVDIKIPDRYTQEKVGNILDCLEVIIDKRKSQIELLDSLVKSRFVDVFGDPISNPFGWSEDNLSNIGVLGRGVSKHRPRNAPELLGGMYPLIQTGDVSNADLYIDDFTSTYSELGLKQSKMWSKGTLCITIAANIAKTSILNFDSCFPDSVVGFDPSDRTNNIFMHYWFSFFQQMLESQAPESAQKNINLRILSGLKVIVPPIDIQEGFADFVQRVDKLKLEVRRSLDETQVLFDSLMQQYFE